MKAVNPWTFILSSTRMGIVTIVLYFGVLVLLDRVENTSKTITFYSQHVYLFYFFCLVICFFMIWYVNKQWQLIKLFFYSSQNNCKRVFCEIILSNLLTIILQIHKYKTYFISFIRINLTLRKSLNYLRFQLWPLFNCPRNESTIQMDEINSQGRNKRFERAVRNIG